ncbi:MAG TPA: cytochrome c peroxidase [Burkholderiales bacterium]
MEKRRRGLWLLAAAALTAPLIAPSWACDPGIDGTRLESPRYVLSYKAEPVTVAKHFALDIAACARPGHPAPESLKVDAHMPQHRHGMNYAPAIEALSPGRWRAEGLMLHMPGRWEFVFELRAAGSSDRLTSNFSVGGLIDFEPDEIARILKHGPWPPPLAPDPSNRVSGRPQAIALGEKLFFEPRLSGPGSVLCATCHAPFRAFQDGRARAFGLQQVDRNTPTVVDARFYRWFGWDGAQDSLWAQSIRPLLDPREMDASPGHVAKVIRTIFPGEYEKAFGREPPQSDEEVLVDTGKALAAFQETLVSARTPFDDFRDALARGDADAMERYPLAAQRGLRIFVGKGNCSVCHFGPHFTNGEFADTGVPFFVAPGRVDAGRHAGLMKLKDSPFNLLGRYNDDASKATAVGTRQVQPQHRNFGEFRVPSLRNVALTAPYMHNGSLASLRDVAQFYSELNEERLHADGEKILRPLKLSRQETDDLVAFLQSLSPAGDMVRTDARAP